MDHHQIAKHAVQGRRFGGRPRQQGFDFSLDLVEALLDQEPAIERRPARVGHARRLNAVNGLAAGNAVDVEGRVARGIWARLAWRSCAWRARRRELPPEPIQHDPMCPDGAHALKRHAAVRDVSRASRSRTSTTPRWPRQMRSTSSGSGMIT